MNFSQYFPMTRIVSLPERRDRRREMITELASLDMRTGSDGIEFFDAIRPENAAGFPSRGARGCFLSHLQVLREAAARECNSILVIEDDLSVSPLLPQVFDELLALLQDQPWGIAYFGYTDSDKIRIDTRQKMVAYHEGVGCTYFYAVHRRVLPELITFLETVLSRQPGDPRGGPMHYDGALTTFRAQNPHVLTLLAYPCLGFQRSSRSDIYIRWYERIPGLRQASELARVARLWLRRHQRRNVAIMHDPGASL